MEKKPSEVHGEQKKMGPPSYSLITQVSFPATSCPGADTILEVPRSTEGGADLDPFQGGNC